MVVMKEIQNLSLISLKLNAAWSNQHRNMKCKYHYSICILLSLEVNSEGQESLSILVLLITYPALLLTLNKGLLGSICW